MKTKEELSALKEEVENLNKKLAGLSEDDLKQIVGGSAIPGLEAIGPFVALESGNLSPEEIQRLRELADSLKSTSQNIR